MTSPAAGATNVMPATSAVEVRARARRVEANRDSRDIFIHLCVGARADVGSGRLGVVVIRARRLCILIAVLDINSEANSSQGSFRETFLILLLQESRDRDRMAGKRSQPDQDRVVNHGHSRRYTTRSHRG